MVGKFDMEWAKHRVSTHRARPTTVARFLVSAPIRFYQLAISPLLGPRCRFYPTCSNYALEAIQVHGAFKGGVLALARILRCHPWHPGGLDPVPPRRKKGTN